MLHCNVLLHVNVLQCVCVCVCVCVCIKIHMHIYSQRQRRQQPRTTRHGKQQRPPSRPGGRARFPTAFCLDSPLTPYTRIFLRHKPRALNWQSLGKSFQKYSYSLSLSRTHAHARTHKYTHTCVGSRQRVARLCPLPFPLLCVSLSPDKNVDPPLARDVQHTACSSRFS